MVSNKTVTKRECEPCGFLIKVDGLGNRPFRDVIVIEHLAPSYSDTIPYHPCIVDLPTFTIKINRKKISGQIIIFHQPGFS